MYRILLADNDLAPLIHDKLFTSYDVDIAYDTESFYTLTYKHTYSIYIVNFHYLHSIETLINSDDKTITFIIDEYYNIRHLKKAFMIADDYLIKPINPEELKIRIDYQFKKLYNTKSDVITYGTMLFHKQSKQLYNKTRKIKLSPAETKLLECLLYRIHQPILKDDILERLETSSDGTLRVYVSKLNKLGFKITYERANLSYTLH